tara:strand:- start:520 stop:906 length:387 start_codon:yes stop_codon:yes gene_type:complete
MSSVARFAGAEMEKMLGHGVDFGSMGQKRTMLDGKEAVAGIQGDSYIQRAGIQAEADVESAKLTGAAQSKLAGAQAQGSMFRSIGGAISQGMGGLGSLGGGTNIGNMDVTTPAWTQGTSDFKSFYSNS